MKCLRFHALPLTRRAGRGIASGFAESGGLPELLKSSQVCLLQSLCPLVGIVSGFRVQNVFGIYLPCWRAALSTTPFLPYHQHPMPFAQVSSSSSTWSCKSYSVNFDPSAPPLPFLKVNELQGISQPHQYSLTNS